MKKEIYKTPYLKVVDASLADNLLIDVSDQYSSDPQLGNEGEFDENLDEGLSNQLDNKELQSQGIWGE